MFGKCVWLSRWGANLVVCAGLVSRATLASGEELVSPTGAETWNWHAQTTTVFQSHPSFRAAYSGDNSLPSHAEAAASYTATLYLGRRLWPGAELYVNPEFGGGRGIGNVSGLAAFPNGDLVHLNGQRPAVQLARVFLRQTVELGVDQERFDSGPNQLAGSYAASRLTFTFGRLTPSDTFDNNTYAHDPRTQFLNWALADNGAWDYPVNAHDTTWGAVVELNQPRWALRYGIFTVPTEPDAVHFDHHFDKAQAHVAEFEWRYDWSNRPGKLRFLGFWNRAKLGSFRDALTTPLLGVDVAETRDYTSKLGWGVNWEQEFTDSLGGFARYGWNDGRTETMGFADINETFSLGLSLDGSSWNRPADQLGFSGIINGLSKAHRDYLAAGGDSLIIGDGRLSYGYEEILECYYRCSLAKWLALTADYQLVIHPAYNRDRGPVSVVSGRLHVEF